MLQPPLRAGHNRRLIVLASILVTCGFLAGIALGGLLWYSPPPSTMAETLWPVHVSADFTAAPANTTLVFTLSIVRENRALGTAVYTLPYPAGGAGRTAFVFPQTLEGVPQTLQVIFRFHLDGAYTFLFNVSPAPSYAPGSPYATPLPYFQLAYGYPQASPIHLDGWRVDLQEVG